MLWGVFFMWYNKYNLLNTKKNRTKFSGIMSRDSTIIEENSKNRGCKSLIIVELYQMWRSNESLSMWLSQFKNS